MATKECRRVEVMSLRSSRRVRAGDSPSGKPPPAEPMVQEATSNDHNNQIEQHKQQQNSPKNQKESTSPPNHDQPVSSIVEEPARRITRSSILLSKKNIPEVQQRQDPVTPEGNISSKNEEEATCKKIVKVPSMVSLSQPISHDLASTVKKPIVKLSETLASPYSEIRKSYRKIHKRQIISIPYRKCHDAFEGRIVSIINKIEGGKNCLKDFQSLIEKMQRINAKDMINRYIIAGIKTIIRLGREKDIYDTKLIEKLEREEQKLRQRILQQLDVMDGFQEGGYGSPEELVDTYEYRRKLIKKIYRIMKGSGKYGDFGEMRERAMRQCQKYFNGEASVGHLVRFIKQRMEVPLE